MNRIILMFLFFTFIFISSCRTLKDTGENIGRVFSDTKKVKNKITDPIKPGVKLSALWIGHATVLIQMDDKVILTDPWFTDYCAEMQKRVVEPGMDINVLKKCDMILISHSHFDHLNLGSLSILEEQFPGTKLIFPETLEDFLPDLNFNLMPFKRPSIENKVYLGESKLIDGVKVTAVAAYHWGGRYGLDGLLWDYDAFCGYIIEYKGKTVYFAGDTAYDDKFYKFLGDNYNIDVEFIPIGPCKDEDFDKLDKKNRHVYPKGALKILEDSKAKLMIPIHYETIAELSDPEKPRIVLEELLFKQPELKDRVNILKIGEQLIIDK